MSINNNNLLLTGEDQYNIQRSLRFRSSASSYLNRTPTVAGNQQKWTWSGLVKRGALGIIGHFICAGTADAARTGIAFSGSDTIFVYHGTAGPIYYGTQTTPVFRDASAWYHLVVSVDTTQATAANRVQIYINSVLQSSSAYSAGYISQNTNTYLNATNGHAIASNAPYAVGTYMDGYLTEVNFIDGQALTPSSFGSTNPQTGVWQPKKYTGTYGTNGFYLPFTDVATTSGSNAGLGKDFSGNGNYWNTNNISVTAGATYDSMKDVPTLTDADTANYCVINPLQKGANITISDGNLKVVKGTATSDDLVISSIFGNSGKFYCEATPTAISGTVIFGVTSGDVYATGFGNTFYPAYGYSSAGNKVQSSTGNPNATTSSYGATYVANDVIGIAIDTSAGSLTFYKNGVSQGTAFTGLTLQQYAFYCATVGASSSGTYVWNFGQRPFAYTPPTGFKALNTYNLPTPTIGSTASTLASKNFDISLYNGNGSTQAVTNAGGFQPDLVWVKGRNYTWSHYLFDVIRTAGKALYSNLTNAEATDGGFTSFNSNGFSVGSGALNDNTVPSTYVAWQWKANGSAVTNTAGSITSQVSANVSAGFSVVNFAVPATSSAYTIGHGLGIAPKMVIVKGRGLSDNWVVYHSSVSTSTSLFLRLNTTDALISAAGIWGSALPTSSVFSITANTTILNNQNAIAYCFSEVAGYSKFGSYVGNGSADGTFVHLGFRPKFVLIKNTTSGSADNWIMQDTSRSAYNLAADYLIANGSHAENTYGGLDFTSNGFKIRTSSTATNASSNTYIYMAFAETPFRYSLGR